MSSINKAALHAAASTFKREPLLKCPGFDGVFARECSALERQQNSNALEKAKSELEEVETMARVVVQVACDAEGNAVFDGTDIPAISKYPARVLQAFIDASNKAAGYGTDPKNG